MPKNDRETDARLVAREYEQGGLSVREIAAAYELFENRLDGVIKVAVEC